MRSTILACSMMMAGCTAAPRPAVSPAAVDSFDSQREVPAAGAEEPRIFTDADFEQPPAPPPMRRWPTQAMGARRHCATAGQARRIRCAPPRETPGEPVRLAVIGLPAPAEETQSFVSRASEIFGHGITVQVLPASIDPATLIGIADVLVLPSGWAQHQWKTIWARASGYQKYVEAGGGLLIFQPNPHGFPGNAVTVDLAGAPFTVANSYHDHCVIPVAPHPVLCGLHPSELPYPADRITDFGQNWKLLTRGAETGHGSLMVMKSGQGRAAVDSDNNTARHMVEQRQRVSHSDELLRRLVLWLARRLH